MKFKIFGILLIVFTITLSPSVIADESLFTPDYRYTEYLQLQDPEPWQLNGDFGDLATEDKWQIETSDNSINFEDYNAYDIEGIEIEFDERVDCVVTFFPKTDTEKPYIIFDFIAPSNAEEITIDKWVLTEFLSDNIGIASTNETVTEIDSSEITINLEEITEDTVIQIVGLGGEMGNAYISMIPLFFSLICIWGSIVYWRNYDSRFWDNFSERIRSKIWIAGVILLVLSILIYNGVIYG